MYTEVTASVQNSVRSTPVVSESSVPSVVNTTVVVDATPASVPVIDTLGTTVVPIGPGTHPWTTISRGSNKRCLDNDSEEEVVHKYTCLDDGENQVAP